ncbi:Zinc finger protein 385B [Liparis tanakae]|uniref:Zinc finger protein 385B n=1 Tax=Liparis tanakae TaxID=230148 RepID=A0A4Z2GMC8_9TELE|nr:Zinc finger protein 385B [Liparis tanakae]
MKPPRSPDRPDGSSPPESQEAQEEEDVEEEDEEEEERKAAAVHRAKRERRQGGSSSSATMCRVCNIQLNSNAQAQIHYRGKTHQRRLRRLAKVVSAAVAIDGTKPLRDWLCHLQSSSVNSTSRFTPWNNDVNRIVKADEHNPDNITLLYTMHPE